MVLGTNIKMKYLLKKSGEKFNLFEMDGQKVKSRVRQTENSGEMMDFIDELKRENDIEVIIKIGNLD